MGEKNALEDQLKRRSATQMAVQLIASGVNRLHGDFAKKISKIFDSFYS